MRRRARRSAQPLDATEQSDLEVPVCRNIKTLFNFEPPATDEEIQASALQFVRKLSGFTKPSKANEVAFDLAVEQVTEAARTLIRSLVTVAQPRDREAVKAKAMAEAARRFPKQ
jgi:hypothetical protein